MLVAGLLSGAVGYFIPTPFQLLKVRLQGIDAGKLGTDGRLLTGARVGEVPLYGNLRQGKSALLTPAKIIQRPSKNWVWISLLRAVTSSAMFIHVWLTLTFVWLIVVIIFNGL